MPKFYVQTTGLERMLDAEDWRVEWGLVIFYEAHNQKVFAVQAETVKQITMQPPPDSE